MSRGSCPPAVLSNLHDGLQPFGQGRAHTAQMLDGIIDDWLEPATQINMRQTRNL